MGRERRSSGAGFTLIEMLVAVAIIGIVLAAIVPAFVNYLRINTDNEIRSGAVAASQTILDQFRVRPKSDWPASGTTVTVPSQFGDLDVRVEHQAFCQEGTCYTGAERISLEVSHRDRVRYTVSTVFTALD